MGVLAWLPGCAGQAADAVSAYTQVKTEDAPAMKLHLLKLECPDCGNPCPILHHIRTFSCSQHQYTCIDHDLVRLSTSDVIDIGSRTESLTKV